MLKELEETVGEDLKSLSHWGTEPTLTTSLFKDFYEQAFVKFPKLEKIFLSSNFLTPPENIVKFANEIIPKTKKINFDLQMSIDGPSWITDKNRGEGAVDNIKKNIKYFFENADGFHAIRCHFKPTINADDIEVLTDIKKLSEYYQFFDDFIDELFQINKKEIQISLVVNPTVAVPGDYTIEDGIAFYKVYQNQKILRDKETYKTISSPCSFYEDRFLEKINYFKEFRNKHRMFTCSAGDSCFGSGDLDNMLYSCHRSYYLIYDDYKQACQEWPLYEQTMNGLQYNRDEILKKLSTTNTKDKLQTVRMLYVNRLFHDFSKHKLSCFVAMIRELSDSNHISSIYKDWKLAEEFAKFLMIGDCQMDNVMASGTFEIPSFSLCRLFGNGVFEAIMKNYIKIIEEEERINARKI
jgi:sulfatase maturation enzyme AslB (radical SAM superfamily)